MQPRRTRLARLGVACAALVLFATACGNRANDNDLSPTPGARQAPPTPTAVPTPQPTAARAPTVAPGQQQPGGMHANVPMQGEFAVTANQDDRTLSVIPVGAATVAATLQLDLAPASVSAAPNSDTVLVADSSPTSHVVAVARLNTSTQADTIDAGVRPEAVGTRSLVTGNAPLLVVSDADNTIRTVDPGSGTVGAPLALGAGPHTVSVARGATTMAPQVYVTNAGDGSITVLDAQATTVQGTLHVGGRPVGVVRTVDSHLWVADADSGTVSTLDPDAGPARKTIEVGPHLTGLAATPDGHYLALSSSDADQALYAVDLLASMLGRTDAAVRHLAVDGGVLALATGAEIARAYATTRDGRLLYWDLAANSIAQSIAVGRNPVGLALGLVPPSGSVAATTVGGGGTIADTGGGAGAGGGAPTSPGGISVSTGVNNSAAPTGGASTSTAPTGAASNAVAPAGGANTSTAPAGGVSTTGGASGPTAPSGVTSTTAPGTAPTGTTAPGTAPTGTTGGTTP